MVLPGKKRKTAGKKRKTAGKKRNGFLNLRFLANFVVDFNNKVELYANLLRERRPCQGRNVDGNAAEVLMLPPLVLTKDNRSLKANADLEENVRPYKCKVVGKKQDKSGSIKYKLLFEDNTTHVHEFDPRIERVREQDGLKPLLTIFKFKSNIQSNATGSSIRKKGATLRGPGRPRKRGRKEV
jgi:outer membrane cobalamin receptor